MVKKAHHLLDGTSTLGAAGAFPGSILPASLPHGLPESISEAAAPPKPARKQDGKSAGLVAKKSQSFRHQGR